MTLLGLIQFFMDLGTVSPAFKVSEEETKGKAMKGLGKKFETAQIPERITFSFPTNYNFRLL